MLIRAATAQLKRRPRSPTLLFTWLQAYASLVGALSTAYPSKVLQFMVYQSTIIRCYKDFESPAWVQYDRAFCRQAAVLKNLECSQVNTMLYSLCFASEAKRCSICAYRFSDNHTSEGCPGALPTPTSLPVRRATPALLGTPASNTPRSTSFEICRLHSD